MAIGTALGIDEGSRAAEYYRAVAAGLLESYPTVRAPRGSSQHSGMP
jgi:hypothetical protein